MRCCDTTADPVLARRMTDLIEWRSKYPNEGISPHTDDEKFMLQVGVGADGSQEFHLLFDILTCQLSRHYCMIGREKKTHLRL